MDKNEIEIITPMSSTSNLLEQEIVELKHKGYRFREIALALNINQQEAYRIYKDYEKEHEDELFAAKMEKVIEINTIYPKMISISQEELEKARKKNQITMTAGWVKLTLEAAREYREFLESIGFFDKNLTAETIKHKNPVTDTTDPIIELIKLNKQRLIEEMKKTKEADENGNNQPNETLIQ